MWYLVSMLSLSEESKETPRRLDNQVDDFAWVRSVAGNCTPPRGGKEDFWLLMRLSPLYCLRLYDSPQHVNTSLQNSRESYIPPTT